VYDDVIQRDIDRTFPNLLLFNDHLHLNGISRINRSDGSVLGKKSLYNVLRAYANHDSTVGYCQGMGFIVGLFLTYLTEEESFWLLFQYMRNERYNMFSFYAPGMSMLHLYYFQFDELIKSRYSKLHSHLHRINVEVPIFSTQWFMTLFAYNMPFELVTRIFDIFFCEGASKVSLKFSLFIMGQLEKRLLSADMELAIELLKNIHQDSSIISSIDLAVEKAMSMSLKTKQLEKMAHKFEMKNLNLKNLTTTKW